VRNTGIGANQQTEGRPGRLSRRRFIRVTAGGLALGIGGRLVWNYTRGSVRADVFVASVPNYHASIETSIRRGLRELGMGRDQVRGKSVMLKPNLVEPSLTAPHINTHPAVVCAAAEVFRSWDAREVFVAEGSGHCRDTDLVLEESGLGSLLENAGISFVDLNTDDVYAVANTLGKAPLRAIWLPKTLRRADLIVSIPKMKTHHWVGVTASMKNLFGVMPGMCYGWPKNVLHQAGIPDSILDIVAAVKPHLAIVDGITGMEGDGPIMGAPKDSRVLVMGRNLPAVDATCTRLMGIDPGRISYLAEASGLLGPIQERYIDQRGENINPLTQQYKLPPGSVLA
jgi:uncharacterized protein (DUF362 family)